MRPPAFQFYPDDFVSGTTILTTEEVGAYILLLCHQWSAGHIPDDDCLIRRIARVTQAFPLGLVLSKFEKQDGVLKNARLEHERAKQMAFREKQAKNGQKGGRPKGLGSSGLTQKQSQTLAKKSSPSPSPSPNNTSAEEPAREEASGEPAKERPRNLVWDAICELFALDPGGMTEAEKSKIGKVVKQIKAASPDVTRDEIRLRAAEYRKRFPNAAFTPTALLSHWSSLAQQELPQAKSEAWKVKNIYDCTR